MTQKITRALLSVHDKTGLAEFARFLHAQGIEILSTGGSAKAIAAEGVPVKEVAEYTGLPEMLDGRVKTLHPAIHGGLLARRDASAHMQTLAAHGLGTIDLVAVNLYPFEQTVASGADFDACIEQIDIGGPAMIRSAAKNHAAVTVLTDPADYALVMEEMKAHGGGTLPETRRRLAAKAYARTAAYDSVISRWFAAQTGEMFPVSLTLGGALKQVLHYGENPHQKAAFYATGDGPSLATARQALGETLSYNNLNDASAAFELAREFAEPAVAIVKHANPCGVATGASLTEAYQRALACDPVSAYGGIVAVNRPLDAAFAQALGKLFVEVMIAPGAAPEALAQLNHKKKLRLLLTGASGPALPGMTIKTISGGFLYQEEDALGVSELKIVSKRPPAEAELADMRFAFMVAKHVKSNAIVLARDGATVGIGAGQMSRIDSTRIACMKAKEAGLATQGGVLASDAFFPFADNVDLAAEAGITAIIQPGGSIRDEEVVAVADRHGMAMVFTGIRHFRH